ncbi:MULTISPECIES: hypothetical protein [unclassified Actinomadura]|uniref:hypothetical protein n=1 Tax=unclassified Actinomadura TaxID=2626254 RepID=UPI0011EDBD85|nr:hypothetical protein [Actinomadura sp. K4S16]
MTDQMLKDALAALADRAPDPVDGLAERAVRTAARRRRTRTAAACAATLALALAVPATVMTVREDSAAQALGSSGDAEFAKGLPKNTPEQLALARICVKDDRLPSVRRSKPGDPTPQSTVRDAIGPVKDFRVLTSMPVKGGHLMEVGSPRGLVVCVSNGKSRTMGPWLNAWPGKSSGGLFGFSAPLRVDAIRQIQALSHFDDLLAVVAGRAKPGVARIRVTWEGGRAADAAVQNGFFIAQTPTRMVPDHNATGVMSKGAMSSPTIRVLSVTGYNAAGRVLHTWSPKVSSEEAGFATEDCTDGMTRPRPTLCD